MIRALLMLLMLATPAMAQDARPVVSVIAETRSVPAPGFVGQIEAGISVDLGFPMVGTMAERMVSLGEQVARGDALARLDPEDLMAQVRSAEAGVSVAEANASSASDARDRAQQLAGQGAGTQVALDSAERGASAANAALEQARATLVQAEDQLSLATLTAPRDGIVTEVYEDQGATLAAGDPVLQLSALTGREIVIDLSEEDATGLTRGDPFRAELIAAPDITAEATLGRIEPVASQTTRTRRVHLDLADPPQAFRIGALARVRPVVSDAKAIALPLTLLLDPEGDAAVWVVDRGEETATVRRTPVTVAGTIADHAVISDGISPGAEIVARGIHSLTDGQPVGRRIAP